MRRDQIEVSLYKWDDTDVVWVGRDIKLRTDGLRFFFAWESHGSTPFLTPVSVGVHNADSDGILF
jgi:hypothetical protein